MFYLTPLRGDVVNKTRHELWRAMIFKHFELSLWAVNDATGGGGGREQELIFANWPRAIGILM